MIPNPDKNRTETLSDKILITSSVINLPNIRVEDVKEFIKQLKAEILINKYIDAESGIHCEDIINELAGDKLI